MDYGYVDDYDLQKELNIKMNFFPHFNFSTFSRQMGKMKVCEN